MLGTLRKKKNSPIILVLLGLAVQNLYPFVPGTTWDDVDKTIYKSLVPLLPKPDERPSRVTIIEVDPESIAEFGWPLRREALQAFLVDGSQKFQGDFSSQRSTPERIHLEEKG